MIPAIGFIIGIYTTIRLISIGTRDEKGDNSFVRGMSVVAAIATVYLMISLQIAGEEYSKQDAKAQAELKRMFPQSR